MAAIPSELQRKDDLLRDRLRAAGRVVVAFSGGVDSSYLALAAACGCDWRTETPAGRRWRR